MIKMFVYRLAIKIGKKYQWFYNLHQKKLKAERDWDIKDSAGIPQGCNLDNIFGPTTKKPHHYEREPNGKVICILDEQIKMNILCLS